MQCTAVQINESLTAGIDLDMVISEYEALEKVNNFAVATFTATVAVNIATWLCLRSP